MIKNKEIAKEEVKATKKITKLSDLNQIDGKRDKVDAAGNVIPTTLDQLLGSRNTPFSVYGTDNLEDYQNTLSGLNLAELRNHAVSLGRFVPNSNRERLIKQLTGEFIKYKSSYNKPSHIDSNVKLSKSKLDSALKIMSAVK